MDNEPRNARADERQERMKQRMQERFDREKRQNREKYRREYDAHVTAYPLNDVGTHKVEGVGGPNGEPITINDLRKATLDRVQHAHYADRDDGIDRAAPGDVRAMTGHLHPSTLRGLMDHDDPIRQRHAADSIRQARLALDPEPSLRRYATAVAEAAVMQMPETGRPADKLAEMVCARAILLRSADHRWQRQVRGALTPLSHRPPRPR